MDGKKFFQNNNTMNGLVKFIAELRACRGRDLEEKRINKELANIRSKFKDTGLNGYQKKKYVCKLLYMYILGWEVDFGHVEAVNLISSNKYSEKQIGYLAVTLLLTESNDLTRLVVNSIRRDLDDHNEVFNCLAMHAIANIGGREMSESLVNDIFKLFTDNSRSLFVKKKAGLTLLRIYRKFPDLIPAVEWAPRILPILDHDNLIVVLNQCPPDYTYNKVPAPWLVVKYLRLLQYYPPPEIPLHIDQYLQILSKLLTNAERPKNPQQYNAQNAVLFEAVNLAIHMDTQSALISQAIVILGEFI
eukprot:jgi/Hompol1/4756/HPOL_001838-RA